MDGRRAASPPVFVGAVFGPRAQPAPWRARVAAASPEKGLV